MDWRFLVNRYLFNRRIIDGYKYQFHPFCGGIRGEEYLSPWILKKGECFVDVGANAGGWTVPAAKYYSQVVAFEINPHTATALARNRAMNHIRNARCKSRP